MRTHARAPETTRQQLDLELAEELALEPYRGPAMPRPEPHELVAIAEARIHALEKTMELLRAASIRGTLPTDWVNMGGFFYLMRDGGDRIKTLWGIVFDPIKRDDFARDALEGGHVQWSVIVTGRSLRTGVELSELGSRATNSKFFVDRFEDGSLAQQQAIIFDCQKAAITNGYGRIVLSITGLKRLPASELEKHGIKVGDVPKVEYKEGAQGGKAGASGGQLGLIAGQACHEGKIEGFSKSDFDAVKAALAQVADLTKTRASQVIDWLKALKQPATQAELWKRVGRTDEGGGGEGAGESAASAPAPAKGGDAKAAAPPAAGRADPKSENCPEAVCGRSPEHIESIGHDPRCPRRTPTRR